MYLCEGPLGRITAKPETGRAARYSLRTAEGEGLWRLDFKKGRPSQQGVFRPLLSRSDYPLR